MILVVINISDKLELLDVVMGVKVVGDVIVMGCLNVNIFNVKW